MNLFDTKRMFFTPGFTNLLHVFKNCNRVSGELYFPNKFNSSTLRYHSSDDHNSWLQRVLVEFKGLDQNLLLVEENMVLFGLIKWEKQTITHINIQSLILSDEFVCADPNIVNSGQYLRLDYHPDALGAPLTEPLPHVHIQGVGAPRFSFSNSDGNTLMSFFNFIYQNFYRDHWSAWVKETWERHATVKQRKDFVFDEITNAFNLSQSDRIQGELEKDVTLLKKSIHKELDKACRLRVPVGICESLSLGF